MFRLLWRLGVAYDVDEFLADVDTKVIDEWLAAESIGLDVDGWDQAAMIATSLNRIENFIRGKYMKVKRTDWKDPNDFLPKSMRSEIPKTTQDPVAETKRFHKRISDG